jgi:hypothetical protein
MQTDSYSFAEGLFVTKHQAKSLPLRGDAPSPRPHGLHRSHTGQGNSLKCSGGRSA